jgi:hypothetical protein
MGCQFLVVKCEGYLTFQECLFSLKNMKIFKSPGIDGFTVEFYKFFWNDIKIPLDAILKSTFKSVMGRQFLRKCFGFPSFGMHVINP